MSEWSQQYVDALNSHDPEKVAAFFADDGSTESVGSGPQWVIKGRDAIMALISALDQFSNDSKITLVNEMQSGDQFVIEYEETATNTGKIARGVPATNNQYTVRGVWVGRLDADGKIMEVRDYADRLDLFTQLGLLKAPGG